MTTVLVMGKGFGNPMGMWVRVQIWKPLKNPYPHHRSGVTLEICCRFFISYKFIIIITIIIITIIIITIIIITIIIITIIIITIIIITIIIYWVDLPADVAITVETCEQKFVTKQIGAI